MQVTNASDNMKILTKNYIVAANTNCRLINTNLNLLINLLACWSKYYFELQINKGRENQLAG